MISISPIYANDTTPFQCKRTLIQNENRLESESIKSLNDTLKIIDENHKEYYLQTLHPK